MNRDPASIVFDYLAVRSAIEPLHCDAIIGFGHFDPAIARHCGELWRNGVAPLMIFTGGVGAGSADLAKPEAEAFAAELREHFPEIPDSAVWLESRSTNTGENVRNLLVLLAAKSTKLHSVTLVASPYRQRRVALTWRHLVPHCPFYNSPPLGSLTDQIDLFRRKQQDLVALLPGEIHRLTDYAARGWIVAEPIPLAVQEAADRLSRI
jgi:hypothetical protein